MTDLKVREQFKNEKKRLIPRGIANKVLVVCEVRHPHQVLCGRIDTNSAFHFRPYCEPLAVIVKRQTDNINCKFDNWGISLIGKARALN